MILLSDLKLYLFGRPRLESNGEAVTFGRRKSLALLAYLALSDRQAHSRDTLAALFWPESNQSNSRANLRRSLHHLRQQLPDEALAVSREAIALNPQAAWWVDVVAFKERARDCLESRTGQHPSPACLRALEEAADLSTAPFMAGFSLSDSVDFDNWQTWQREHHQQMLAQILEQLAAAHQSEGRYEQALGWTRRWLSLDPLREEVHRRVMEIYALSNQRSAALQQFQECRRILKEELGVELAPETTALFEKIAAGSLAAESAPKPQHNLPRPLTSFVGREKEIKTVTGLIAENRLVMLTGAGGIGKSHLCLQAASRLQAGFADGAWLVELAPIADPALIPSTVASSLGLRDPAEQTSGRFNPESPASAQRPLLRVLLDYLQDKSCLIILDNCEHVIEAAAEFVQTLLAACAGVKILGSSREALGIPGEIPFRVPPLSVPSGDHVPALDEWAQFEALTLFVERAAAVAPEFQVTAANLPALVQICRRLDGIPLALELAAARVSVLNTGQIADRLDDRFRLLTGGSRTALPRQQTLRALIDWSWDLLTEPEQVMLRRLSVFAGGMNLEAVEEICTGDGLDRYDVLDLLAELAGKSLLNAHREPDKPLRYRLLETIRQYAREHLLQAGQEESFRHRHLAYFQALAARAEPELIGPDQAQGLQRLELELDNMRAALSWARESRPEAGIRLITASERFWLRGYMAEGERWLEELLAAAASPDLPLKARALSTLGGFKFTSHRSQSRRYLEESLAAFRALDDEKRILETTIRLGFFKGLLGARTALLEALPQMRRPGYELQLANALLWLGYYEGEQNNFDQARAFLAESEAHYRQVGHLNGQAEALQIAGLTALWQGDYEAARLAIEESLRLERKLGERGSIVSLQSLGILQHRLGNYRRASDYLQESLALSQRVGDSTNHNWSLAHLGYAYLKLDEPVEATRYLARGLGQFTDVGDRPGIIFTLEGFAALALRCAQAERAARLFAAAGRMRRESNNPRPPSEQAEVERDLATISDLLSPESYARLAAEGRALSDEQAIADALAAGATLP